MVDHGTDFEIDVLEIRGPSPVLGESEEAQRGRRPALLQTALLEHAAAYNLRTVMTFHQKVEEAAAFAEKLPQTAAELYVNDASAGDLSRQRSCRSQGLRTNRQLCCGTSIWRRMVVPWSRVERISTRSQSWWASQRPRPPICSVVGRVRPAITSAM
ncbi:hypothetical protein SHIRM173S_06228 [Streptomyces hirsutus]